MKDSEGSILVETLVATAMIALIVGLGFQAVQQAGRAAHHAEDGRLALLVAQSRMATLGASQPVVPGHFSGTDNGMAWTLDIRRYAQPPGESKAGPIDHVTLTVGLAGTGRPLVTLKSLRLDGDG